MIYVFITFLVIIGIWFFLVWIRKTMWDAVHRNLLDLEDEIEGSVMRRGFASRPIFHGKHNGYDFTINFSSEKTAGKCISYVDISYSKPCKRAFTLSEKSWLDAQQAGPIEDYSQWSNHAGKQLILRPASDPDIAKLLKNQDFKSILDEQDDLAYIFFGNTGLIYEYITEEVIKSTEVAAIKDRLQFLEKLNEVLN